MADVVPLSAALIEALRRSRSVASSRSRSSSSPWPIIAEERKKAAVGTPVRSASVVAIAAGSTTVAPSKVSDADPPGPSDRAIAPVRGGSPDPSPSTAKSTVTVGRAVGSASHDRSPSRPPAASRASPTIASSMARAIVDFPASFGPRMIVRPGARSICRSR